MKHGQWMLNGTDGDRWEACEYFDTKEEAIFYGIELLTEYNSLDNKQRRDYDLSDGLNLLNYCKGLFLTKRLLNMKIAPQVKLW